MVYEDMLFVLDKAESGLGSTTGSNIYFSKYYM